jgi:hypothetical protein
MQALLSFEQAKHKEQLDKLGRRVAREFARRQKVPDQVSLCGLYYYTRSPHNRERIPSADISWTPLLWHPLPFAVWNANPFCGAASPQ